MTLARFRYLVRVLQHARPTQIQLFFMNSDLQGTQIRILLTALSAMHSAMPWLESLPKPSVDFKPWFTFVSDFPNSWKRIVATYHEFFQSLAGLRKRRRFLTQLRKWMLSVVRFVREVFGSKLIFCRTVPNNMGAHVLNVVTPIPPRVLFVKGNFFWDCERLLRHLCFSSWASNMFSLC